VTPTEKMEILQRVVQGVLERGSPHVKRAGQALTTALPDVDPGELGIACMMLGTSLLKVADFPKEGIGVMAELLWVAARPTLIKPQGDA
jgi:hypothetical protein